MELLFMNYAAKVHRLQRLPWFEAQVQKFRSEEGVLGNIKIRFLDASMFVCLIVVPM